MRHATWPIASLILMSFAVQAAQGIHPGPLPTPIGPEGGASQSPPDVGYPGADGRGTGFGRGPAVDPREAADYRHGPDFGQGRPGLSYAPTAQDPGYRDRGYPPPPPAGSPAPRGYWQWVPAEPAGADAYSYGALPSRGGYGDASGYPAQGYYPPAYDAYRETYSGSYSPPSFGSYRDRYPAFGSAAGAPPDAYPASSGYYPEPPSAGRDAGAARRAPSAPDAPSSPPAGKP
jgi:hypothetical protein